jgi:hypothetical protein
MKKIIIISILLILTAFFAFNSFEPSPIFAAMDASSFTTSLDVSPDISITDCLNISMLPAISLSQDSSIGSTTCAVNTTNALGYKLDVSSETSPALVSGSNYFSDISTTTMPATWASRLPTDTNIFGFSIYGNDVDTAVWGATPSNCGTAGAADLSSTVNWYGFYTAATTTITRNSSTGGAVPFVLCVGAEQGSVSNAASGDYHATTTLTASTL